MMKKIPLPIFLGLLTAATLTLPGRAPAADNVDSFIKSFQDNKSYIQPFATLFGSATNSGWYQSSAVPAGFGFYIGFPVNFTQISDKDRTFKGTFVDEGCQAYHAHTANGPQKCDETTAYTAPTLFGRIPGPVMRKSHVNVTNDVIIDSTDFPYSDGKQDFSSLNWLPFVEPQISLAFKYTELKFRYIGVPLSAFSLSMPGVGVQHDLASFLPPLPLSLSVAGNITWLSASWTPGGHISGSLDLTGESHFFGILAGYTYARWLEVFLETGWEGATIKTGGSLVIHDKADSTNNQIVKPNLNLTGRNGFRAALNLAIHFGYDAVLGQNVGAEFGNQVNILAYRYKH